MQTIDVKEIKRKVIDIIKIRGPSLPMQIAHAISTNSIFAGALLSELFAEKAIKISNMKVGGSPLYFIQGQEHLLENFYQYLPGKEKEAFLLLKENKILQDKEQLPAIRVALRILHDFAKSFSKDNEIFWRFHSVTEEQVKGMLEPKKLEKPEVKLVKPAEKIEKLAESSLLEEPSLTQENQRFSGPQKAKLFAEKKLREENEAISERKEVKPKAAEILKKPVVELKPKEVKKEEVKEIKKEEVKVKVKKPARKIPKQITLDIGLKKEPAKKQIKIKEKKPREKSEFVLKIIGFLQAQNIELLEERELKKKEFSGVIKIDTPLGKIKLLCIAKDKKSTTETDLRLALQKSQAIKMPALILYQQEPNKKTLDYAEKWSSLLKLKKIE